MGKHPCLSCGACCAFFRVSFYWREAEAGAHSVPLHLTEDYSSLQRNMRGTNGKKPRCVALGGKVGERVGCTIYESRPSPCRAFQASYENGEQNGRCDCARAQHGLKPLQPVDWPELRRPPAIATTLREAGIR
jgi:Fe-S-cluster containining protein